MNIVNMCCPIIGKAMLLLTVFMCLLSNTFTQETMSHSEHLEKHKSTSVIPEKPIVTSSYEYSTDDMNVNSSDRPQLHHEHGMHNPGDHQAAHHFHNHDISHKEHSVSDDDKSKNHDAHSHHDHSMHSMHSEDQTNASHDHHKMHHRNSELDYELLQDQSAGDVDLQRSEDKYNSKDYDDFGKLSKDDSNSHNHHHHHHDHNQDMDNGNMDHHSMHMNMNGSDSGHGMMMYFMTGIEAVVLFKGWKITTVAELIGSMIGIMILGTFYEALKYLREHLFRQYVSSMQFSTVAVTGESGRVSQVHKVESHRILSWAHALQTCLHVVQIVTSYFLMLIFMTYNVWLCIAVVVGSALGYFIFGWKKATVVDITEHCH